MEQHSLLRFSSFEPQKKKKKGMERTNSIQIKREKSGNGLKIKMASKKDVKPIDVTSEDQVNICTFSRQHRRFQQLNREIAAKAKNIQDIKDASDEVYISEEVRFVFGEAFVTVDADGAQELIEARKQREEQELNVLNEELTQLGKDMNDRKAQLYAKFGSQIYLEDK